MNIHEEARRVKIEVIYEFDLIIYTGDEPVSDEELLKLAKNDIFSSIHDETIMQNLKLKIKE